MYHVDTLLTVLQIKFLLQNSAQATHDPSVCLSK